MNSYLLSLSLANCKDIFTIVGVIVTVIALVKGLFEYIIQGRQKRAEHFFNLRKKLKEKDVFRDICVDLSHDKNLSKLPDADKRDFLGLFEEVAVMKNSGLIREDLAYYMFGYYAKACWQSGSFWEGFNRDSLYWQIFKQFALESEEYWMCHQADFDPKNILV